VVRLGYGGLANTGAGSGAFGVPDVEFSPTLRADLYDSAGAKLAVPPLTRILQASYGIALNRLGNFSLTVPADDEAAAGAIIGRQLWIYAPPEGVVFKGVIERTRMETRGEAVVLVIDGASVGKSLAWKTTLLGRTFNNTALSSVVSTLLTGTTFASGSIATPSTNITVRFDGRSIWDALLSVADVFGMLVREDHLPATPEVDVNSFGSASGLLFTNPPAITPAMMAAAIAYPITSLRIVTEARDVWNTIIPLGQQSGIAGSDTWFDLAESTRSSPYTIQSAAGPDSKTYYYLTDATSVSAYGTRERVLQVRDILPLGITSTDFERAANTLYDEAAAYLQRHKDEQVAYEVDVVGLKHVAGGAYVFQVGDKLRLRYDGVVEDADGRRAFKSVDNSNLYIMAATRTFDDTGSSTWRLTVSTIVRELPNDGNITEKFMADLQAVKAAPLPYVLFGDNVARLSEAGLELVAATEPTITGETERKVAWTSGDFLTRYAEVFGSYYSALATNYMISRVHDGTDAYHVSGIIKSNLTDWDTVQWISKIGGGDPYPWHVDNGSTPLIALEYVDSSNMKLYIRKNGTLREVGNMKTTGGGSYALSVTSDAPPIITASWVHVSHPVVRSKPSTYSGASASSHAVTMPSSVGASDRCICVVAVDGDRTITTPSGWTLVGSQNTSTGSPDVRVSVYYRDGSPGATVTFTLNSASVLHAMTYLISANSFYGAPTVAFNSGTAGGTMDPPSHARPSSTYTATYWIEVAAVGSSTTVAIASTDFGNFLKLEGTNLSLACANAVDDQDPLDPGGMNTASGANWVTATIAQAGYGLPGDGVICAVTTDQDNIAVAIGASGSQAIRGQVAAPPGLADWVRCALPYPISVSAGDILWLSSAGRVELIDEADLG
jgi:hypothetical protein